MKPFSALITFFLASTTALPQPATSDGGAGVFRLDGGNVSYAFGINRRGELQQIYWGGRLASGDHFPLPVPIDETVHETSYANTPQEYPSWGAGLSIEPALKITFADGNRDLVLHYAGHTKTRDGVDVILKDITRRVFVTLHYSMDPGSGILARSATVENREPRPILIEQLAAAAWALPPVHSLGAPATGPSRWGGYTLSYLTGRLVGEWNLTQERLEPGARVIESRRGSTGHQANPWFAIQAGESSEDDGEVWFGSLAWSGSWRIIVEQDQLDTVHITGGFNPFDFGYVLHPKQKLETPLFYGGYSARGLGEDGRRLVR